MAKHSPNGDIGDSEIEESQIERIGGTEFVLFGGTNELRAGLIALRYGRWVQIGETEFSTEGQFCQLSSLAIEFSQKISRNLNRICNEFTKV